MKKVIKGAGRAAVLSTFVVASAFALPTMAAANPAGDDAPKSEAQTVEVPAIEDMELTGLPEAGFKTLKTWSTDNKPVEDISTGDDGTAGGDGEDTEVPGDDEGEDIEVPGDDDGEDTEVPGDDEEAPGDDDGEATPPAENQNCEVSSDAKADRVILVDGEGGSKASVKTCEKDGDTYKEVESYDGHVGFNGIAAEGKKIEGDGKTPSGTYSLDEGFGLQDKPAQFKGEDWTKVTDDHVWIDQGSPEDGYNTMGLKSEGAEGESLNQDPAYRYAQVIDYNRDPVEADKGSAIFLHVNTGSGATAGCVSLPEKDLLDVFEWSGEEAEIQIKQ